jgi:hypothetical protein
VFVSSFSVSEEFVRHIRRLQCNNLIIRVAMLIDYRTARKALRLSMFTMNVADEVLMGNNHSKIILISNQNMKVSVVTSQNQTRGSRYEAGMISTNPAIYEKLLSDVANIRKECINGTELFNGSIAPN